MYCCYAPQGQAGWLPERQLHYGTNEMRVPVKSVPALALSEMWHPFYVFQYFSILIWTAGEAYYSYSFCIAAITAFSILTRQGHACAGFALSIGHVFHPPPPHMRVVRDYASCIAVMIPFSKPSDLVLTSPSNKRQLF